MAMKLFNNSDKKVIPYKRLYTLREYRRGFRRIQITTEQNTDMDISKQYQYFVTSLNANCVKKSVILKNSYRVKRKKRKL